MIKYFLFFLVSSISLDVFASPYLNRWRFEYNIGKTEINYLEELQEPLFLERESTQKSLYQELIFQYFLLPPRIDFSLGLKIAGLQVDSPEDTAKQFTYSTLFTNIGFFLFLGDHFRFKLVAEYFSTSMIVEDDNFGFKDLTGVEVYPEFEYLPDGSTIFTNFVPYVKIPFWSDIADRKELTVGLKIKIPTGNLGKQSFPSHSFQNGFIINFFYTKMSLSIDNGDRFVDSEVETEQYGATVGFNF